jgi:gliding motility-associated-like protein
MSIAVTTLPSANISGTTTVCENGAQPNITFTASNSTAPYTFTYSLNGGANQTITTAGTSSTVTLPVPTSTPGTYVYSISSVNVGACANPITGQAATVTVSSNITPTFTAVGPYCNGASIPALPTTSINSIVGTWAPVINNVAISAAVTTNYTFTPTPGAGICATTATIPIVVNPNTIPLFTQLGPYCQGATPDILPLTSNNTIAGTWSPATISTLGIVGSISTTTYSFTPSVSSANAPQCGQSTTMNIIVSPLPSASISGTTTLCQGASQPAITFTGVNSAAPYTFYYHLNNGVAQTLTTTNTNNSIGIQVPTSNPGTFIYYLDSVSVGSCNNTIQNQQVTIDIIQTPTVTLSASSSLICPNQAVQLTAIGIPASYNNILGVYNWSNCSTCSSGLQTVNPLATTTYTVSYTLNGCTSQPESVTLTVQSAPALTIQSNPNATICEGGCVTLSALQSASSIVPSGYIWSTGETAQSIIVCPTDTTNYSVIGLSGSCESLPAFTVVNVTSDPIITTQIVLDTSICLGGSFTFNVTVSGGVGAPTYQWFENVNQTNFGGIAIAGATNSGYTTPVFNVQGAHFYYCVVSYLNGVGCNAITTEVGSLYVLPDPTVSISPITNQTLCFGGAADCITASVQGGVGTNTYLWIPGGEVTQTFCPPTNQIGTNNYSVIVQQSGIACGSLPSNQVGITVIQDPVIDITGITNVCEGAQVPLNTMVQGGIGSVAGYQWYESNPSGQPYQIITGANSLNYTSPSLTTNASYAVEVTLTGVGCNALDTFNINVFDDPLITIQGDLMACMNAQIDLSTIFTGGTPNSSNLYTWYAGSNGNYADSTLLQSTSVLNTYSFNIYQDTSIFVIVNNTGYGCDNDTSTLINVDGIEWAEASFDMDPSDLSQSLVNPTFSFINTSQNSTSYFWDLGECDPQSPMSELFTPPTAFYDPTDKDQIGYTYGCPPGLYQIMLVAMNQGMCPDTAYQVIRIQDEILVYVPNSFTPDYDENNQYFYPVITTIMKPQSYLFSIYDRWGELIYETKEAPPVPNIQPNMNNSWNGSINGNECQDGTYIWKLRFIVKESGEVIYKMGHVNLLK